MYTLNISRQLITLCAKLQIQFPNPPLSLQCPIALAAQAKGFHKATACEKYLVWKDDPNSTRLLKAVYNSSISNWISRFDRHHKYPAMLLQHVPPIVVRIVELPEPTVSKATYFVITNTKLEMEYIQRSPELCRKAITPECYDNMTTEKLSELIRDRGVNR